MKKYLVMVLMLVSGVFLSLACQNSNLTGPEGPVSRVSPNPTSTPTGTWYTSTPTSTPTNTATLLPTPSYISGWGISSPNGLAAGNGYLYAAQADSGLALVTLFNSPGGASAVTSWTGWGSQSFQWPSGIAVNQVSGSPVSGYVYVLDSGTCADSECDSTTGSAVYVFNSSAAPTAVTSWTKYGSMSFNNPSGLAMDTNGNLYVADMNNYEVEEFGSGGATLGEWNAGGNANFWPAAVAVDGSNNIYVVDAGNYYVWELPSIGGTATSWPLAVQGNQEYPDYGLTVDSSGNVYVADYYNSLVEVYNNSGALIGEMNGNFGSSTPFSGPDVILLFNGNIYVGDYDNDNIQIFGPNTY